MPGKRQTVRRLLAGAAVGEVLSAYFEWPLDVRHGADCFRRRHREKRHSGAVMVHKAGHHFALVDWWPDDEPAEVFGYGRLGFHGRTAGERHGPRRPCTRAHGAPEAADDPIAPYRLLPVGGLPGDGPTPTERDGALALAVGLAADRAFATGRPVTVREVIPWLWRP